MPGDQAERLGVVAMGQGDAEGGGHGQSGGDAGHHVHWNARGAQFKNFFAGAAMRGGGESEGPRARGALDSFWESGRIDDPCDLGAAGAAIGAGLQGDTDGSEGGAAAGAGAKNLVAADIEAGADDRAAIHGTRAGAAGEQA